jgi:hypothetical protein
MLRVIEEALPVVIRGYTGIGRKPYQYLSFIRSNWAMSYFKIGQVKTLIGRRGPYPVRPLVCACSGKFTTPKQVVKYFSDRGMDPRTRSPIRGGEYNTKISFVLMGAVICLAALRTLQQFIL